MKTEERNEQLRRRLVNVPRRLQRTIDSYRVARGMTPLWEGRVRQSVSRSCAD
jgi:hypothetical protein